MPHASWFYVFISFIAGACCAGSIWSVASLKGNSRRMRRGVLPQGSQRDDLAEARALAFQDLYNQYSNCFAGHYLTVEDREDVVEATISKLLERKGDQGLLYQQVGKSYQEYLDSLATKAVEQAAELFLRI
jgi:hypothetical protein